VRCKLRIQSFNSDPEDGSVEAETCSYVLLSVH